jgi:hypothetical protein
MTLRCFRELAGLDSPPAGIHRRVAPYAPGCIWFRMNSHLIQIPPSLLPVAPDSAILISFKVIHTQNSRSETWQ